MATIKFMLEVDRDSGALVNVLNQDGSSAAASTKERRKWNLHDIHIGVPQGEAAPPTSRVDCPPGYCKVVVNNTQYCIPY